MKRMLFWIVLSWLALTGCVKYVEVPVPYRVEVPVQVPCPKLEIPARPVLVDVPISPRDEVLRAVVGNYKRLADYAQSIEILVGTRQ